MQYITKAGVKFIKSLGEDTTVPRDKWNPTKTGGGIMDKKGNVIPLGTDSRLDPKRANRGYVNPKGSYSTKNPPKGEATGSMTTTDPKSKLPMAVVKVIKRAGATEVEKPN